MTLGDILKDEGFVSEVQLQEAADIQQEKGGAFGDVLIGLGTITKEQLTIALGKQVGIGFVKLDTIEVPEHIIAMVPQSVAAMYKVIPFSFEDNALTIAMADPNNINVLDDLKFLINCDNVHASIATVDAVDEALEKYYAEDDSIENLINDFDDDGMELGDDGEVLEDIASMEQQANAAPVIKLLNLILLNAIKDGASDLHFEPFETEFKIRYRVDGVLYEMMPPPRHLASALVSRIKVMANMNIAERRVPQDNRIALNIGGNPVDLRVATLPCFFGESVVIRVLDRQAISLDIEKLGFRDQDLILLRKYIQLPNGIVLVTGPTGSGKTTTLYAAISEINDVETKIITTEDPVEYEIDGLIQVNINDAVGLTYSSCLRAILRQDPDKIFVGEMRDKETATIAIEAALTGHLVFSTLHTNDAPAAITRMIDMGLETFLVAATVKLVLAQRLVKTVCANCKIGYAPTEEELMALQLKPEDVEGKDLYYGKGCDKCNGSGYRGRTAIHELFQISERIGEAIIGEASTEELRAVAVEEGMISLRASGIRAVLEGRTTIEEVLRETLGEEG